MHQVFETEIAGRKFVIETGKVAQQAGGSCLVRYGDTVVLVTATASSQPREGIDFFPLTVDYEERSYAIGKIPGSVFRREGRPTEKAILAARLTDRPLRPLFPSGFRNDVAIVVTVMSVDYDNSPEMCGMIGSSLALMISDIPFNGPTAAVQVGLVDGQYVINPTRAQDAVSRLTLSVAGSKDAILMVEAGAKEVTEEEMIDAILFGHEEIKRIIAFEEEIIAQVAKAKREMSVFEVTPEVAAAVKAAIGDDLRQAVRHPDKQTREANIDALGTRVMEQVLAEFPDKAKEISEAYHDELKAEVRRQILDDGVRPDGRQVNEIRPITCEVGLLPRVHGSGLFTRGQTQVMTALTLGMISDQQKLFDLTDEEFKRYMHHYNFPSYSTGETKPVRGPGRREIGHGALAERALAPMIPDDTSFPYTLRLVSEVLSSNGSTSMASVCGSTLALLDAGVPIKAPVAGIAMGLIKEGDRYKVLTDIQGMEDHLGDMDFKVAGTTQGITAIQMDIKIAGINREILETALAQAREARLFILGKIHDCLPAPRPELSKYAPRITVMQINVDNIRDVIGPGGKMINKIIAECGVEIDIEDDGRIFIASTDEEGAKKAQAWIERLTKDVAPGEVYTGKVTRLMNFGAFVEILPGKEGLIHISELDIGRVPTVEDAVKIGDEVTVKVTEIDEKGRINLSRREVLIEERKRLGLPVEERPRYDSPRREGGRHDGPRRDGSRREGQRHDGPRPERGPDRGPRRGGDNGGSPSLQ
ncbi:MAG: polyribonucleotide nucleotidyltransferase [Chloroflexota bacterium]